MKSRILFLLYIFVVLALGFIHNELLMLLVIAITIILGSKARYKIFLKAFLVIAIFNATITISYLVYGLFFSIDASALLLINLRAFAITLLTFTLIRRINLHKALEFNKSLSLLYAFTYSQIVHLKLMLSSYYDGIKSRGATIKIGNLEALFVSLFATMIERSKEQNMALRSRGLIDD